MKTLEKTINKNGFTYNQVKRNDVLAIYEQLYFGMLVGHEVFFIEKYKERIINGNTIIAHEALPGDNAFGVSAWSVGKDVNRALKKFDQLASTIN